MSSSEISQRQTLIPVMMKEGISISEGCRLQSCFTQLNSGWCPPARDATGPKSLLCALCPPWPSPGRYCSLWALHHHYQAFGDCNYLSLNHTSNPQAAFKPDPWSFPLLSCQWKPQERQICLFRSNFLMPCSLEAQALQFIPAPLCSSEDIRSFF